MKSKILAVLSFCLVVMSVVCVVIIFSVSRKTTISVYDTISNKTISVDAYFGNKYKDVNFLNQEHENYILEGFYYDINLTNKVDKNSPITSSSIIYAGYIKLADKDTTFEQPENIVGVKFLGDLSSEKLEEICKLHFLDLSQCTSLPKFPKNNLTVQKIIFPKNCSIENLSNYQNLKEVYFENVNLVKDSFNNCPNLEIVDSLDATIIENSFNLCDKLKIIKLSRNVYQISNSFVRTNLTKISSLSTKYPVSNGALYEILDDEKYLVKVESGRQNFSVDGQTSKILDYAFLGANVKRVVVSAKVSSVGKYCFAQSSVESVDFSRNSSPLFIDDNAFENVQTLSHVNFGQYIFKIGKNSFKNTGLVQVDFSNSAIFQSIDNFAFTHNKNLQSVKFSTTNVLIGEGVFADCSKLESVENLNTENISKSAFRDCKSLISINQISNLKTVEEYAFFGCSSLENIAFSKTAQNVLEFAFSKTATVFAMFDNLEYLKEYAFADCENLSSFSDQTKLVGVDFSAFENCPLMQTLNFLSDDYILSYPAVYSADQTSLVYYLPAAASTTFLVPATVSNVSGKTLAFASNLQSISSASANFVCEDGVLYEVDGSSKTLICYPQAKTDTTFVLPSCVSKIGEQAFVRCPNLLNLYLEEDLSCVENSSLWQLSKLVLLKTNLIGENYADQTNGFLGWVFGAQIAENNFNFVPTTLLSVHVTKQSVFSDQAFYNCQNLTTISLDECLEFSDHMFFNCKKLTNLSTQTALEKIGNFALYNCQNLNKLTWGYNENITLGESSLKNTPNSNMTVTLTNTTQIETSKFIEYRSKFNKLSWAWSTQIL